MSSLKLEIDLSYFWKDPSGALTLTRAGHGCRVNIWRYLAGGSVAFLTAFTLVGCDRTPTSLPEEYFPTPGAVERAAPNHLLVDLYVDTSFSMRGFVARSVGINQDFAKLIDRLDTMSRRNPGNLVRRWLWGGGQAAESGWLSVPDFNRVRDANAYAVRGGAHPPIDDVFSAGTSVARFTIIATDLRLDGLVVADLAQQLARKTARQDHSLGIFSVRLPFDGEIDRPTRSGDFRYHGMRRIYVLFFGYRPVVEQFAQSLKTELQRQFIDADALIFSPRIVSRSFDVGDARIERLVGLSRREFGLSPNKVKLLQLESLPDTVDGSIDLSIPLNRSADGPTLTPPAVDVDPTVFIWRSKEWTQIHPDKTNLKYQKKIVRADTPENTQQLLIFDLAISAPTFFERGWYYLDCRIRAKPSDLELPPWVADADLPRNFLLENSVAGNLFQGRTPGLRHFLESLQGALPGDTQDLGNLRILLKRQR